MAVLLPLAHEYQIDELTKRCEQFLLSQDPSFRSLVLAYDFSLPTLKKKCLDDYVSRLRLLSAFSTGDSRKSRPKLLKNMAHFCENHRNHGKDGASNYDPGTINCHSIQSVKVNI